MGVEVVTTQEYTIQEGLITAFTCSWSEESVAAVQAATAALPVTGGELFPTHALVAVLGGLGALGAAAIALLRRRWHR